MSSRSTPTQTKMGVPVSTRLSTKKKKEEED
jgi:hypothetical protein